MRPTGAPPRLNAAEKPDCPTDNIEEETDQDRRSDDWKYRFNVGLESSRGQRVSETRNVHDSCRCGFRWFHNILLSFLLVNITGGVIISV